MKLWTLLLLLVMTVACAKEPIKTSTTDNKGMQVDLLFTHDGCKVYRFEDDGIHYYVVCQKVDSQATMHDWCEQQGKTCYWHHDDISTVTQ